MLPSVALMIPTTTSPARVTRLRKLPASVDQATLTLAGSSAALPVSARYSDFVRAPMGPIERSTGHGAWKLEVSSALDVGESWNLGVFLAHALIAHGRLQEKQGDVSDEPMRTVWATGVVDVIDLRILQVGHIETKARQALAAASAPDLFLLPPDNLGDIPAAVRVELEARGTRIIAPATMAEALEALELPPDWAKVAAPEVAGWRGSPYRGLEAYEAEHRPIFFGRGHARAEALERLRTRAERGTSLLVIHGKSGVGKSSLAMAGLLNDVVEKVPGRAPFGTALIRFGDGGAPLVALRNGFAQALGLEDVGLHSVGSAADWIRAWPANGDPRTLLLILDQLEQALLADEADTIAFGEALAALVRTGRVWIIATLRSDRIDLLERAPALAALADGDGLYRLVRPTLAELSEIIRAPAKLAGIEFAEGEGERLVDLLAQEAMSEPDSLPLLQVTLMRLAEQRDAAGRVGMRDYERIGGFSGAVERLADETVRKIEGSGVDASIVDRALATLVRIDPETDRVDARVVDPDMQPAEVERVLGLLVEARLATASTLSEANELAAKDQGTAANGPQDSGRRVRLAHETLIREWPRLRDLAARLRTELALRDRLEEEAARWEHDGRPTGDLIRNTARLTTAEELVADGLATPSPQARIYIKASRTEIEREAEETRAAEARERQGRSRRVRITVISSIMAMIIVSALGVFAWVQREEAVVQKIAAFGQSQIAEVEKQRAIAAQAQAEARRAEAVENESVALIGLSRLESSLGHPVDALKLALAAWPRQGDPERPQLKSALAALSDPLASLRPIKLSLNAGAPLQGAGFSPDGRLLYSLVVRTVQIWDAATGAPVGEPIRLDSRVGSVKFSPDSLRLLTAVDKSNGSEEGIAQLWDVQSGRKVGHEMRLAGDITTSDFSPNGSLVIVGSVWGSARVFDATTGAPATPEIFHSGAIWRALFSPDGQHLLTASSDNTAQLWDALTVEPLGEPIWHEGTVGDAGFSPDGRRVVTASDDGFVRVWDIASKGYYGDPLEMGEQVNVVEFSPDGRYVAALLKSGTLRIISLEDENTNLSLGLDKYDPWEVSFSPDGRLVAAQHGERGAKLFDVATGIGVGPTLLHDQEVRSVEFSPDGSTLLTASEDGAVRLWDAKAGAPVGVVTLGDLEGEFVEPVPVELVVPTVTQVAPEELEPVVVPVELDEEIGTEQSWGPEINVAAIASDGRHFVTADETSAIVVWDIKTGDPLDWVIKLEDQIESLAFSPDSKRMVAITGNNAARLWDSSTGTPIGEPMQHRRWMNSATFSPDGRYVATASGDQTARIWVTETGKAFVGPMRHEGEVNSATFSPNGMLLVTASADKTARVWNTASGTAVGEPMLHKDAVMSAIFSPDGGQIVTVASDKTVRTWDTETLQALSSPMRHDDDINTAEFSPDGRFVVTASNDMTARLWDAATGVAVGEPMRHDGAVGSASFSPSGKLIVTRSSDGAARLWDVATSRSLGAPMQHKNWINFVGFFPDGGHLLTASSDGKAQLWDTATAEPVGAPFPKDPVKLPEIVVPIPAYVPDISTFGNSSDGQNHLVAYGDGVWICPKATRCGNRQKEPNGIELWHDDVVNDASFSPEGDLVATASSDGAVIVWDAVTGEAIGNPMLHESAVDLAGFSPDGQLVLSIANDGKVRLWKTTSGELKCMLNSSEYGPSIDNFGFSPDGFHFFWDDGNTVQLWRTTDCSRAWKPVAHQGAVTSVSFSKNGQRVLTSSSDQTAQLWDAATGERLGEPMQHVDEVNSAAFLSADDQLILTRSIDGAVQLWSTETGKLVQTTVQPFDELKNLFLGGIGPVSSPDGRYIVADTGDNSYVLLHPVSLAILWTIGSGLNQHTAIKTGAFSPDGRGLMLDGGESIVDFGLPQFPSQELWEIACARLGNDKSLDGVQARYGLGRLAPICGDNNPAAVEPTLLK